MAHATEFTHKHTPFNQSEASERFRSYGFEMLGKYVRSGIPVEVRCLECGYVHTKRLNNAQKGRGCPKCKQRRFTQDQASVHFLNGKFELLGRYVNSYSPVLVRCVTCGDEQLRILNNVRQLGAGCDQSCGYRYTDREVFDLFMAAGFEVLGDYRTKDEPLLVRCIECGFEQLKSRDAVQRWNSPCLKCGDFGWFNPARATALYLMSKNDLVKVGKTSRGMRRIREHRRYGWNVERIVRFAPGEGAQCSRLESELLGWLRDRCEQPLTKQDMPQGGHTEVFRAPVGFVSGLVSLMAAVNG